jgi:hypothetical protein
LLVAGSAEALAPVRQCRPEALPVHCFVLGPQRITPYQVLRHLLDRHGSGCWCLLPESGALLVPPYADRVTFADLCSYLDRRGFESMAFRLPRRSRGHALRTVRMFMRDPLSDSVFPAEIEIDPSDMAAEGGNARAKLALFKYRPGVRFGDEFGAASDFQLADIRGAIVPLAPRRFPAHAPAVGCGAGEGIPEASLLAARGLVATSEAFDAFLRIGDEARRLAAEGEDCC